MTGRPARAPQLRLQEPVFGTCSESMLGHQATVWAWALPTLQIQALRPADAADGVDCTGYDLNGQPGPNGRSDTEFRHPIAFLQEPMMNLKRRAN